MRKDYIPPIDMWLHFEFKDCSNPYISFTQSKAFWILTHYDYKQTGARTFTDLSWNCCGTSYREKQDRLREIAIDWQNSFMDGISYDYGSLADWQGFFEEYGRRYGLLTEFREKRVALKYQEGNYTVMTFTL